MDFIRLYKSQIKIPSERNYAEVVRTALVL